MTPIIQGEHVPPCPRKINVEELRRLRKMHDMSVRHLSIFSGVNYWTLAQICQGKVVDPQVSTVDRIALALNVSIEDLLEFDL